MLHAVFLLLNFDPLVVPVAVTVFIFPAKLLEMNRTASNSTTKAKEEKDSTESKADNSINRSLSNSKAEPKGKVKGENIKGKKGKEGGKEGKEVSKAKNRSVSVSSSSLQRNRRNATVGNDKFEQKVVEQPEVIMDEIDWIIFKREKKISIEVPTTANLSGHRLRISYLSEKDMLHLMHEVRGTKYGPACRPELTLVTVGRGARFNRHLDLSNLSPPGEFPGAFALFDASKELIVMCDSMEDKLITLQLCDPEKIFDISNASSTCELDSIDIITMSLKRVWRRYVNMYISPKSTSTPRMAVLNARIKRFEDAELVEEAALAEAARVAAAAEAAAKAAAEAEIAARITRSPTPING